LDERWAAPLAEQQVGSNGESPIQRKRMTHKKLRVLATIRHPNLCSFYGDTISQMGIQYAVLEWAQYNLFEIIHNRTMRLEDDMGLSIINNVACGMNYLHLMEPPVLHGNLKTANVLVDGNFVAKVAEFGLSIKADIWKQKIAKTPEALRAVPGATKEADVYAFGKMVVEIFLHIKTLDSSTPSTKRMDSPESVESRSSDEHELLELAEHQCAHAEIRELVKQCQHHDPRARPSFSEIVRVLEAVNTSTFAEKVTGFMGKQRLLDEILPPHVAQQLASGQKAEPEHFDAVTIFFSDIVGFTSIAQTLAPAKVMCMLDNLYGKFDSLVKKHELFKVETIGDAYMCVGNLRSSQPDHAHRIARFAMDAVVAAKSTLVDETDPSVGFISIRAGFHSGPVVASVVGITNPRYCLFGDTVNVASRMESNSKEHCVHLSDQAQQALEQEEALGVGADDISLVYRGKLNVKGKGAMVTFWLLGYHPSSHADTSSCGSVGGRAAMGGGTGGA